MGEKNDTYYIKLQGKANIPVALHIGHNFKITADCSIVSEQRSDNEDGTYAVTYKAVPVTVEIEKDNGEVIKAADPRKNSVKFRNYLRKLYFDDGCVEDFDRVYDSVIDESMAIMPHLFREALKRLNR
jgi:hypothetical protein